MPMPSLATLLGEMRANPEAFLRHYRLDIGGGAAKASGVATFRYANVAQLDSEIIAMPGFTTGLSGLLGLQKQRRLIKFTKVSLPPKPAPDPLTEFEAHYIAMTQTTDGPATTHVVVPGAGGPDIMLTSQLSGCGFGIGNANGGGDRILSHIQPPAAGVSVHGALTGGMGGGGTAATFEKDPNGGGRDYAGNNRATVIGVRNGTAWSFYAQVYDTSQNSRELFKVVRLN